MNKITRYRDIQLIEYSDETYMAVACDVLAAIGPKEKDLVKVSGEVAGYFATLVPLIELISIGGVPLSVADTIGVEMVPTGESIIKGILQAMEEVGLNEQMLTGSTEDNIPTDTTSVGITVIGEVNKSQLLINTPMAKDYVVVIGIPKMGQQFLEEEILDDKGEVMTLKTASDIRGFDGVHHMLPVGSKGIQYELKVIEDMYGMSVAPLEGEHNSFLESLGLNVTKSDHLLEVSAGPATCMIVTCDEDGLSEIKKSVKQPIMVLGQVN